MNDLASAKVTHPTYHFAGQVALVTGAAETAAATLWMCSPAVSFVVGIALPVDGGFVAH